MPHVEGVEIPVYVKREKRKKRWLAWYTNTRNKALTVLGGGCACGEVDPANLQIEALTPEAKEWSQLFFYKRITDAYNHNMDPLQIGRVTCKGCRYTRLATEAREKREALRIAGTRMGTGEFYWIGGSRAEQLARKLPCQVIRVIHEDLRLEWDPSRVDSESVEPVQV